MDIRCFGRFYTFSNVIWFCVVCDAVPLVFIEITFGQGIHRPPGNMRNLRVDHQIEDSISISFFFPRNKVVEKYDPE